MSKVDLTPNLLVAVALLACTAPAAEHPPQGGFGWKARPPLFAGLTRIGPSAFSGATSVPYNPSDIRKAYGLNPLTALNGQDGYGITIAIVDAYGYQDIAADLATFSRQFGLPVPSGKILPTFKVATYPSTFQMPSNSSWAVETSLDVQWAHAIAPRANILLVAARSASDSDLMGAVAYAAKNADVVSLSWGGGEFSGEKTYESYFLPKDIYGNPKPVTFLASSGDSGAGVSWPAVSPNVVGVGGTSLYFGSPNAPAGSWAESAWTGSGGGISRYFTIPSFQQIPANNMWPAGFTTPKGRMVPDVSMVADPNTGVLVYSRGSWYQVGGTSASAPIWAGIVALADQNLTASTRWSSASLLNKLYDLAYPTPTTDNVNTAASWSSPPANDYFFAVEKGSSSGSPKGYPAAPIYDLVTGIGTPFVPNLLLGLSSP